MTEKHEAAVEFIDSGRAGGKVAARLLANNMNPRALRTLETLTYEQWIEVDKAVAAAARKRLIGVTDLENHGCLYQLTNALGKTVLVTQTASDLNDAEMGMNASKRTALDRPEFDIGYLPLPITHKDFQFDIRQLAASRDGTQPLDLTTAELAGKKVAEKIEYTLFRGASSYTAGGGTIYGYCDFPSRNTKSHVLHWDHSAKTGELILDDVRDMKQKLINDNMFGPYILYVPTNYEAVLDDDFKAASDKTIRQRVKEIEGIEDVKIADFLADDNVVLVQMSPETVRIVNGFRPTTVEWDSMGGLVTDYKVWSIMVPQMRADASGKCGICHMS